MRKSGSDIIEWRNCCVWQKLNVKSLEKSRCSKFLTCNSIETFDLQGYIYSSTIRTIDREYWKRKGEKFDWTVIVRRWYNRFRFVFFFFFFFTFIQLFYLFFFFLLPSPPSSLPFFSSSNWKWNNLFHFRFIILTRDFISRWKTEGKENFSSTFEIRTDSVSNEPYNFRGASSLSLPPRRFPRY